MTIIAAQTMQSVGFAALARAAAAARLARIGEAMNTLADAVAMVYRGQSFDLWLTRRPRATPDQYFRLIALTTASLFAGVARCGALLGNRRASEIRAVSSFASNYGMALQLTDDVLDVMDEHTGKTVRADLTCRRMRLPLIAAMRRATRTDRRAISDFLSGHARDVSTVASMARIIERSGGVAAALDAAAWYRARSLRALRALPAGPPRDALAWLPESLLAAQGLG
jgi:geranylgeranyl pyrophosphate synthase